MEKDIIEKEERNKSEFEFKDLATAQEYSEWKKMVPAGVRRLVESTMKGNVPLSNKTGLALSDQFLKVLGESLAQNKIADLLGVDKTISNLLSPLEHIKTESGYINVFEVFNNMDTSWNLKQKIFETQIKPALDWLIEKDLEKISEEKIENKNGQEVLVQNESVEQSDGDLPPEQNEAISSMEAGEKEKKEGEPVRAIFSVSPFFWRICFG
ncbi:MAG: hypothetical protein Q7U36_04060 [bacterium]|nr:hypothetical protein [bacterium]